MKRPLLAEAPLAATLAALVFVAAGFTLQGQATSRPNALPAVVAAVRAAEQGAPLPAPLTPAVGDLRGDFYFFPAGCIAEPGQTSSEKLCRLGDETATKTLVVIGDSHADMWTPPILRMAVRDGWAVIPFVKLGCIPDFWARGSSACRTWYRWAIEQAAALHPDAALIIGSWSGSHTPRAALAGVAAATTTMKRAAGTVSVVGDAPMPARNPAKCLASPGATMATCTTTATRSQLRIDDAVAASAKKRGVGYISTRGWFCARSSSGSAYLCPVVIGHAIVWVDSGHIGQTYGLELADPFRDAFRRELTG